MGIGGKTVRPNYGAAMPEPSNQELRSEVLKLAGPVIVENFLMTLVGMADMIMVGSLGPAAIASIGLSNSPIFFSTAAFAAISVGATALVARHIGAKEPEAANLVARQALLLAVIISVVFTAVALTIAPNIMVWMGAKADVQEIGTAYLRISTSTFAFSIISMIMNGVLRGAGDTKTPMRVNIVANLVNIVFNYLLIFGHFGFPRWGVAGAAAATALSRLVGGLLVLRVLFMGKSVIHITLHDRFAFDWTIIRRMMNIGVPAMLEQLIMRGGQLLYTRIVSGLGTLAYAAHTIAINVESLSFMPGFGFSIAATTLIGQNLGANRPDVAERSGYESVKIGMLFMGAVGLILFFFPGVFVRLYTDDPEVTRMAVQVLRIVAISQPPMAAAFIFAGGLRGAGDTRWVMIITSASVWIVRLGLAYLLAITLNWQLVGAWIAMTVELFVRGTAIALRYRTGRWKKLKV